MKTERKWRILITGCVLLIASMACNILGSVEPTPIIVTVVVTAVEQVETPQPTEATETTLPTPIPTPTEPSNPDQVKAEANRDGVFTVTTNGQRNSLVSPQSTFLSLGEGIDVDEVGRAILRFSDLLSVEVLRDGGLIIKELAIDEQSAVVTVLQNGGTLLNDFNPQQEINRRLTIQTEFATVTATGTSFLVVRESNTPLEWVVGLDAQQSDLTVTSLATGLEKEVVTGVTRWISPIGDPSVGIEARMDNVQDWLGNLTQGERVSEIGDVVWNFADQLSDTSPIFEIPPPGESLDLQGVPITFFEGGGFGLEDCNNDGVNDVSIFKGEFVLDLRNVPARVKTLDITIINRTWERAGTLTAYNPAFEEITTVPIQVGASQGQILSIRSDEPIHFARLRMTDGCFLGYSLTPQEEEPRPIGALIAEITNIRVEQGLYNVDFVTYGYEPARGGLHVHFFFNTVPPEEAGYPGKGPWILYYGPSPFTGYALKDLPPNATRMCILVANSDHSVQPNSGNCYDLP